MSSGELSALYQQVILDHARERHGFGLQPSSDGESHQLNPTCGDELTLQVHLREQRAADASQAPDAAADASTLAEASTAPVIDRITWEGHGCAISQSSASLLSDLAEGLPVAELSGRIDAFRLMMRSKGTIEPDEELFGDAVVLGGASRYIARVKCAMLAWVAAEDALRKVPAEVR